MPDLRPLHFTFLLYLALLYALTAACVRTGEIAARSVPACVRTQLERLVQGLEVKCSSLLRVMS